MCCPQLAKADFWFYVCAGKIQVKCFVVFLDIFLHVLSPDFHLEKIHSLLLSVGTKAQPLPQSNTSCVFHFEVKMHLKYIGWFNQGAFIMSHNVCSSAIKYLNKIQTLHVFPISTWIIYFLYFTSLFNDSNALKLLFFLTVYTVLFSLPSLCTFLATLKPFRGVFKFVFSHLDLSVLLFVSFSVCMSKTLNPTQLMTCLQGWYLHLKSIGSSQETAPCTAGHRRDCRNTPHGLVHRELVGLMLEAQAPTQWLGDPSLYCAPCDTGTLFLVLFCVLGNFSNFFRFYVAIG